MRVTDRLKGQFSGIALAVCAAILMTGCAQRSEQIRLTVWGPQPPDRIKGWQAAAHEFERRNPGVRVEMLSLGAGSMNPQKLMTAIVGKAPPDVIYQDRFTVADWAARDTFMPLNSFLEADKGKPGAFDPKQFYKAAWDEVVYKGNVYGIPADIDTRPLFVNLRVLRQAGLGPDRIPKTWDDLVELNRLLTKRDKNNSLTQVGFIPNFGNSWFYLYSWQMNGEFMSADGKTCTMNNPQSRKALQWLVDFYRDAGGVEELTAFQQGFKGNSELDPFLIGQVAMKVDCGQFVGYIARYAPDLEFVCVPPPVPAERLQRKPPFDTGPTYLSWSGGFSWAIPRGARHADMSWKFIKFMESLEGYRTVFNAQRAYNRSVGRPFVPYFSANQVITETMLREYASNNPRLNQALRNTVDLMPVSRYRPVTYVAQRLWDEHNRAFDNAIRGKQTVEQALAEAQKTVQKEMDKFTMRMQYPLLNWRIPVAIALFLVLLIGVLFWRHARQGYSGSRMARSEAWAGVLFAMPWILGFLAFTIGPILASLVFSFCDYDVLHAARWVGLKNYQDLFGEEWYFTGKSLANIAYLTAIGLPLGMLVSLSLAMLLNTNVRGMRYYRTIYYLPSIMPIVANAVLWLWVLNPQYGLINVAWRATLTEWFGIPAPLWLGSEATSKPALIVMGLWGAGGGMILWLAGLQGIPRHLYEAAEIDGAGWWTRLWHVTIPMLTPYIFFNLIMGVIGVLQSFEAQYIMTGGGPADSTLVPVLLLFNNAFAYFKMGYASAIAWVLFILILILTLLQLKASRKWVYYEGQEGK